MQQAIPIPVSTWQTYAVKRCRNGAQPSRWAQSRRSGEVQTAEKAAAASMDAYIEAVAHSQDRAAFEALFRYFAPRVKTYLLKLGSDAGTAEELVQETMALVWRKAGKFDAARSSASTWIYAIARNVRIDAYRKEKRPELDPNDPALVPDADPSADTVLMEKQAADQLRIAVAGLSENEQDLLRHAYLEDKSHSMIAAELGIPLGTVKSRMRLAFAKLRKQIPDGFGGSS